MLAPVSYKVAGAAGGFVMLLVKVPPGVSSPPHIHETMEFLYVLEAYPPRSRLPFDGALCSGYANGHSESVEK